MLELKKITKIYKTEGFEQKALDEVSINFRRNEFVSILGQSGSGKTTLLNIIGGLDHYTSGDLIIDQKSTKQYKNKDWDSYRNHRIGFVFQSYNLITHQSILSNVELALTLSGISKSERKKRAKDALKNVGLGDHMNKKPSQLSGGQMQRVAIARALVNNPDILLADEPTGALDSETSIQIMDLLKEIAKEKLVIMVTHNPELAEQYSTRIIRLKDGHMLGDTNPYSDEECAKEEIKEQKENAKKTSMSLLTALSLSLNNLMTKKGRTILTSIAGSIGIIGIALILSLSNGVRKYIDDMQKDALASEAISMEETSMDLGAVTNNTEAIPQEKAIEENKITTKDDISTSSYFTTQSMTHKNNLAKFKTYLEENKDKIQKYAINVQYAYNVDLQIYHKDENNRIYKVSSKDTSDELMQDSTLLTNSFSELVNNEDILKEQYEVVSGKIPSNYNELVLVVDENNQIPLSVMYSLGIKNKDELTDMISKVSNGEKIEVENSSYDYNELIGKKYKLILNSDYYIKENGKWIDKSLDSEYLSQLYDNGMELEIVGIIKAKSDIKSKPKTGFMGYTNKLTEYVISNIKEKEITKQQLENKEINVLTGEKFDNINSSYEDNLKTLGIASMESPSKINIYPKDFESKKQLKQIIEDYNKEVEEKDQIKYSDLTETLLSGLTTAVNIISYILIAFVAISLVVSGIMISIITYISVLERTKEIGILRAIGASKKDVSRVFKAETIIEGLISGGLGIAVTLLLNLLINVIVKAFFKIDNIASMPFIGAIILILISSFLTLIAGTIPSKMASKKDPVEALRSE